MKAKNFTEEEWKRQIEERFCSEELTGQLHAHLIILSMLHIFLSSTAVLGNTLIFIALYKESSLHPPSKLLYRNLTVTDICVGIIAAPLAVIHFMAMMNKKLNVCRLAFDSLFVISYTLCSVSLLTMIAISVDRLLALLLGLRYRQVVTQKRTYATVTMLWVVSVISAGMYFLNPLIITWNEKIGISLCLITSIFCYSKVFLTLRHNQIQRQQGHVSQERSSQAIPLNIARYRKAVSSALWVQVTLVICYLPYGIAVALTPQEDLPLSVYLAIEYTSALVYLNSSLNPLLYCWKIREVRQAVKETIRQIWR